MVNIPAYAASNFIFSADAKPTEASPPKKFSRAIYKNEFGLLRIPRPSGSRDLGKREVSAGARVALAETPPSPGAHCWKCRPYRIPQSHRKLRVARGRGDRRENDVRNH